MDDFHNTIDTMKFSSFVSDYMYDDAFHDMVEAAGITPLDFLEQKIGEALDPIRSLELDSSRNVLNLSFETENESEKEF